MHPRNLEDEDCLGRNEEMPVPETEQFLQTYLLVQGNHEKLLPVSKTIGIN